MFIKVLILLAALFFVFIGILIIEGIIASLGEREQFTNPKRESQTFGQKGDKLRYLVMGDSTGAGQGADYSQGIAVVTAKNLAQKYQVEFLNTSISGAQVKDVLSDQLEVGLKFNPDLVLISIGANDVTGRTSLSTVESQLDQLISKILESNCKAKIVLTASPDMGTAPRFAQPLRYVAGLQSQRINKVFDKIILKYNLTLAPIAKETGPLFKKDKSLFAEDRFHPNERGYATWITVLNPILEDTLTSQPLHCK